MIHLRWTRGRFTPALPARPAAAARSSFFITRGMREAQFAGVEGEVSGGIGFGTVGGVADDGAAMSER